MYYFTSSSNKQIFCNHPSDKESMMSSCIWRDEIADQCPAGEDKIPHTLKHGEFLIVGR